MRRVYVILSSLLFSIVKIKGDLSNIIESLVTIKGFLQLLIMYNMRPKEVGCCKD
ncbi:hypothetical protein [Borrelia turicatae]|uniref:Uncharacterized protein n=1 Tax=Borrelia turicatae (strain 91E135) TaxID=314724 RepID=T1ECH3_BORT9|nr:hypothetical protein BTA004 [Borrelia turicatae 91E135]